MDVMQRRRELLMAQKTGVLPSVYEELGPISASKTIELPLYGRQIGGIELTQKESTTVLGYKFIFIDTLFAIKNQMNGDSMRYVYDGIDTGFNWDKCVIGFGGWVNRRDSFYTLQFLHGLVLVNGVQKTTYTKTESGWVCDDETNPLSVNFYENYNNSYFKELKVYGLDEETIIGDFIGCKRKSDSVEGLYDLVTKQFYS